MEVVNILEEVMQNQEEVEDEEDEEGGRHPSCRQDIPRDQGVDNSPAPISVKLSYSAVFPTPPAVPQQAAALPTEMDSVGLAIL